MADGHKAFAAILILGGGAAFAGYNVLPHWAVLAGSPGASLSQPQHLVAAPADDPWRLRAVRDETTGKTQTKLWIRQDNGSGAYAETEASCEQIGKGSAITFITLIVDQNGSPTIGITNRASASEGKFVRIRYRQNDVMKLSRVPNGKFSNEFVTFSAIDDAAAEFYKTSPIGVNLYVAGLEGGLLFTAHYSNVQLVKAEYQTDHGPLIVTIDTASPSIKRLYADRFGAH